MAASRSFNTAMFVAILVLFSAAPIAGGYFLASSHTHGASKSVLEVASEKPENPEERSDNDQTDATSKQVAVPDKNMAKTGEKFKPMFEHAKDSKEKMVVPKYPIIHACHTNLAKVFGKYTDTWWKDWKLSVGLVFWLAVWAKWIIQGYEEVYHERALHAFGVNIIILHMLQYSSSTLTGMAGVCALLIAQTLFENFWYYKSDGADHEMDEFNCDTLYLDLALPVEQISVLFIAQFGVWWFYMTSILGNFDFSNVNYLFWFWAYLVMQMTMIFNRGRDSVLGNPFPLHDVYRILLNTEKVAFVVVDENDEPTGEKFHMRKANILMRGITGFFCNAILRDIMAYTIPLMLMGFSEPMDFVVYCVGVNFICTLDDMSERKYVMTELKDLPDGQEATAERSE